ncbi:MAG: diguanylate cyclase [Candidatus Omnitrophica bacterium]|nr:diguanylate cyclase [Candidatus Omnitrophota bacterium]
MESENFSKKQTDQYDSYRDYLTGALNRSFLYQFLPQALSKAEEQKGKIALFMIDLDNFKEVNDSYGHLAGDKVLKIVSTAIKEMLDGKFHFIRYAGDEFIIVAEGLDYDSAQLLAKDILDSSSNSKITVKEAIMIQQTLSVGFSLFPDDSNDIETLIDHADSALYLAKSRNKNNFAYYNEVSVSELSLRVGLNAFPCKTFINHDSQIYELKKILANVQSQAAATGALVFGLSGMGKSRLTKEAQLFAKTIGNEVISFYPHQKDCLRPYHLIAKTLDDYINSKRIHNNALVLDLFASLNENEIKTLNHFLPSLFSDQIKETGFDLSDNLIHEAFVSFFAKLSRKFSGLFLIVDNSQYSDIRSLEIFYELSLSQEKITLAIVMLEPLPESIYNSPSIKSFFNKIINNQLLIKIEVKPFSFSNTILMIDAIFPGLGENEGFAKIIFDRTNGQPFFIEELLKHLLEQSIIYFDNNNWQLKDLVPETLPKSFDDVIRHRLRNLTPELKETLLASSVIGKDIDPQVLSRVKSQKEGAIIEILEKAKRQGILSDEGGTFSFPTNLTQSAVFDEISDQDKHQIYNKATQAISDINKNHIDRASFQLGNLFRETEDIENLNNLSKKIFENASEIINRDEILAFLKSIAKKNQQPAVTDIDELRDEHLIYIAEILKPLQSAFLDFKLYPETSKIREEVLSNLKNNLDKIFVYYKTIEISEIERSLIVNKRRISNRMAPFVDIEAILNFIIERDIKSIYFSKGLTLLELNQFLSVFVSDSEAIDKIYGENSSMKNNSFDNIILKKADYSEREQGSSNQAVKDKIQETMISEFLLGKIKQEELDTSSFIDTIKNNPQKISQELLRNSQGQNTGETMAEKLNSLSEGMNKLNTLMTNFASEGSANPLEIILNVFSGFDAKVQSHLIRKANSLNEVMMSVVKSLDSKQLSTIVNDAFTSGVSLWGMRKLMSKLNETQTSSNKDISKLLSENVSSRLKSGESKKFIVGEINWSDLDTESQVSDILKFDQEDISDISSDNLISVLIKIIESEDYHRFVVIFDALKKQVFAAPDHISEKISQICRQCLKIVYDDKSQQLKVFKTLNFILNDLKKNRSKKDIIFTISLLHDISGDLNLGTIDKFTGEKIVFLNQLFFTVESIKDIFSESDSAHWLGLFNISQISEDLLEGYLGKPVLKQLIDANPENYSDFISLTFGTVLAFFEKRFLSVKDPFEKFVILNKLKGIFSGLNERGMLRIINTSFLSEFFPDILDILVQTGKGIFSSCFSQFYRQASIAERMKTLEAIEKVNLKAFPQCLNKILEIETDQILRQRLKNLLNGLTE